MKKERERKKENEPKQNVTRQWQQAPNTVSSIMQYSTHRTQNTK